MRAALSSYICLERLRPLRRDKLGGSSDHVPAAIRKTFSTQNHIPLAKPNKTFSPFFKITGNLNFIFPFTQKFLPIHSHS